MGMSAFGIDFFAMKAYSKGLELSLGTPILVIGGTILTTMFAFIVLQEKITPYKVFGATLAILGYVIMVYPQLRAVLSKLR